MDMITTLHYDWNDHWRQMMITHDQSSHHGDCSGFWNDEFLAQEYQRMTRSCHWKQSFITILTSVIQNIKQCSLVDIGAGPGVHTIPLSQSMDRIISVEPSSAMMSQLRGYVDNNKIDNIKTVQKKWEDVDISVDLNGGCDIILSSFSLGMYDLNDAIQKMIDAADQYVFLIWHHGISRWEQTYIDLWPKIHQIPYQEVPKDDVLLNVLAQMGVQPQVESFQTRNFYHFQSFSHALEYFTKELHIKNSHCQEMLSRYLSDHLLWENGYMVLDGHDQYVIIHWEN